MAQHSDDSEMSRFDREGVRHFSARQSVLAVALVSAILIVFSGGSVLNAGEEQTPGIGRDLITAVGKPTNEIADSLPFQQVSHKLTSSLSPNQDLDNGGQFRTGSLALQGGRIPPITPQAFDPVEIGGKPPPKKELGTLLVTGDSLSQPLDTAARPAPRAGRRRGGPRLAPGDGDLEPDAGRLGAALQGAGLRAPPRRRRCLHRRQRGVPAAGARGQGPALLRAAVGCGLRQPAAADDGHLPPGRRRPGLLADRPHPARQLPPDRGEDRQRGDPGRRPAVDGPDPHRRHGARSSPRGSATATRSRSTETRRSSASPTASTSTTSAPASPPTRSCERVDQDFKY